MYSRYVHLLLALGSLLAPAACAEAEPVAVKNPLVDVYGDPLPHGATARIGTVRLRHGSYVYCVAFSPDGKTVVSGGENDTIRCWQTSTGKELRCLRGHKSHVMSLKFQDEKTLVSIGQDFTIRFWDLASGKETRQLQTGHGGYYDVTFSPDGRLLASCGQAIRVWETKTYQVVRDFGNSAVIKCGWTYCLAFSTDGKTLATGNADGMIRFWDPANGKEIRRIEAHKGGVRSLAFSPDGKYLVSAGDRDGMLTLREAATGKEIRRSFAGGASSCPAFSPDGKILAGCGQSGILLSAIHLLEASTGKEIRRIDGVKTNIAAVAFSPDGAAIAAAGSDGTVRLWSAATGKELLPCGMPSEPVESLALSADGTILATGGWLGEFRCWDTAKGKLRREFVSPGEIVRRLAFSPDGEELISLGTDGFASWDVVTGRETRRFAVRAYTDACALTVDGKTLVAVHYREPGSLYDVASGKEVRRFTATNKAAFLPDGQSLVVKIDRVGLGVWDIKEGKIVRWFQGGPVRDTCLAVSPNGETLIAGTDEQVVLRWDIRTEEELPALDGHQKSVDCVAFSPDGRTLASGGADGTIWLWEMTSGQQRGLLRGHQGAVLALDFSRDGRRLASGSRDTTALIWDLTDGTAASRTNLTPKQLDDLWGDLAGQDAIKAYQSMWILASDPKASTAFLRRHLRPAPAAEAKRVAQLLAELDSDQFDVRTKARKELEELGESAAASLRAVNAKPPSVEVRLQVKALLEKLKNAKRSPSPERIRALRAVEVLERLGTSEARALLKDLAGGAEQAQQTLEAKASLQRLSKRSKRSE